jgi:uncharacterized membrane protein YkgB
MKNKSLNRVDLAITGWMSANAILLLRISIGIIFFWFGLLKFFKGLSPAETLAIKTIDRLTFHMLSERVIITGLAAWETIIGIGLIFKIYLRATLLLLFLQMLGTFTPLFLFPSDVFTHFPYALTIEGQYIFKNIVVISGGIVIGATVREGRLTLQNL